MNIREKILKIIHESKALNNSFYKLWLECRLTLPEFLIFTNEYFGWVQSFPDTLLLLALHTPGLKDKLEFLSTAWSESGYGRIEKVHLRLFTSPQQRKIMKKKPCELTSNTSKIQNKSIFLWMD